ncbi:hypothetical protein BZA05DRAFT_338758 [Tricharina praecox]|uniref:uncharacterized protein n=1 Tax=Tricharina praecox TaxID=43433 RepID=UPI002220BB21|nr:uncharacterized protein BZA05DRAFT_338758 [Tricharina praecox]KAI5850087.1 hypothetical protein BZA05DRAFT_338758 [Tricharina praecox]
MGKKSPVYRVDVDASIVAGSVARGVGAFDPRPQPSHSQTAPVTVRRLSDKSKDSGWEEAVPSASSSDHSLRSSGSSKDTTLTTPMMSRGNTSPSYGNADFASNNTTPRAGKSGPVGVQLTDEPEETDMSFSAAAALAAKYENESTEKTNTNRVMTRAQYEFQQQQDDQRRLSGKADDEDSDVSDYEEETDMEKNKEIARQRARQEAHLSVYRQQMMKISGSDPSDIPFMNRGSMSTSALPLHGGMDPGSSGKNSDEEEDDEVPLAILLAHGFPSKNRPPTRLSNASSQPNLRGTAQSQQQLPVFARHLPQDPYNVGASLVNPMNRVPLSFHAGNDNMSNAGGSMYGGMPPSQAPGRGPGGLVGEIVRAEEQKAFRRGLGGGHQYSQQQTQQHEPADPFKVNPFDRPASRGGGGLLGNMQQHQGGMGPGMMGGMGGMGGMGSPGMMGGMMAGGNMGRGMQQDPAQAQMAAMQQQYMQMQMQMQMQFMQMQMQGGQQQPLAPPPMMGQQQRPVSMMSMHTPMGGMGGLGVPQMGNQRAMSIMDPHFPQMQQGTRSAYAPSIAQSQLGMPPAPGGGFYGVQPGYTPSIAPSERSTLGQPSRYRPVTYHQGPATVVSAPISSGSGTQDWNRKTPGPSNLKKSTTESDEDEDGGWEELNKKRQEKADGWKKRRETGGLKGILNFGSSSNNSS